MTRILLFLAANASVLFVFSIASKLLGLDQWAAQNGIPYQSFFVMALIFGFGGSFISLAMSKWMAKRGMGVQIIENPRDRTEAWLLETVRRQSEKAGIGMPEVGIFRAGSPNAFATGMSRDNALVAVSVELMQSMSADEVEAVLAHEVSHVANGDMVTMGLLQGVLNTFVIFFARVGGMLVDQALSGNRDSYRPGIGFFVISIVFEMVFGVFAAMIAMAFSRWREFRADAGGAALAGRPKMIAALQALQRQHTESLPAQMAAFGISGGLASGFKQLLMSHPPLEERIQALRNAE
ncbi:peptidase family M48 [gamma proteobacterium HTCC5015]|nr:peptidase family M48 [gamma proteobacterium HTCC5015]